MMKQDTFVSVDIEADGPIPGEYSMISMGAVVVGSPEASFYRELRPITERFVPEALQVTGLDREKLLREGVAPEAAMGDFASWLAGVSPGRRPVFVGFNATFDWMFVNYYFHRYAGKNPFGISGLDIKAYYMGALGKRAWGDTAKRNMEKRFLSDSPHTHHALDDAREQAEVFLKVKAYAESRGG